MGNIDHAKVLAAYIQHVLACEGTDFAASFWDEALTAGELAWFFRCAADANESAPHFQARLVASAVKYESMDPHTKPAEEF